MEKTEFFRYSRIFIGSIFAYTLFFIPQMALGSSNGTIQTTAEQTEGNEQVYLVAPSYQIATSTKDDRIRWNGYASTTGTYMAVEDTATTIPLDPATQRFYILSYTADSLTAIVKYTNQDGTERTINTYTSYPVTVDGDTYYLFKMASTTAGDTSARNIKWYINRRYILFTTLTNDVVESEVTNEATAYSYMDQLNSEHYAELYTPTDPLASQVLAITSPLDGSTTASTTVSVDFIFYNANAGTQVDSFNLWFYNRLTSAYTSIDGDLPSGEYGSVSYDVELPVSTYDLTISLFPSGTPELLYSGYEKITFNVVEDPLAKLGVPDFADLSALATSTCSITNISGCMQNALLFLFYPSETVLDKYSDLKELVQNKPPFGYLVAYTASLSDLSAVASSSFSLEIEDNIQDNIFTPIRSGLSGVLWVCFGCWFFNRIRKQEL